MIIVVSQMQMYMCIGCSKEEPEYKVKYDDSSASASGQNHLQPVETL